MSWEHIPILMLVNNLHSYMSPYSFCTENMKDLNEITKSNNTDNNYLNVIEDRTSTIFTSSYKLFQQIISDKTLDIGTNHNKV